jgi:glycosyltransferase involved in cell wall biosynthesis
MIGTGGPRVSVVIPARNAEPYLGEAIRSVLDQTLPPDEVIVVNDGSTDATGDVADSFGDPVRCVGQPPLGLGAALNRGLEEVRARLIAFLDADDLWLPEKQALQVRALAERDDLDMVFGKVEHFHSAELSPAERGGIAKPPGRAAGVCKGAMLIRHESLLRAGSFDTQCKLGEFIDWYARAMDAGLRGAVLPDLVLRRRLHPQSTGVRESDSRPDYARVLKRVLDRRRAEAS